MIARRSRRKSLNLVEPSLACRLQRLHTFVSPSLFALHLTTSCGKVSLSSVHCCLPCSLLATGDGVRLLDPKQVKEDHAEFAKSKPIGTATAKTGTEAKSTRCAIDCFRVLISFLRLLYLSSLSSFLLLATRLASRRPPLP